MPIANGIRSKSTRLIWLVVLFVFLQVVHLPLRAEGPALLIDGQPVLGQVSDIASDWTVTITGKESRKIATSELVRWGYRVEVGKGPQVILADGSVIVADILDLNGETVKVGIDFNRFADASLWEDAIVPLHSIRGIVFRPPGDAAARDKLYYRLIDRQGSEDHLLLRTGDVVAGVLTTSVKNDAAGVEPNIAIKPAGQQEPISIPLGKVAAVSVNPSLVRVSRRTSSSVCIGFRDGSCINVQKIETVDGVVRLSLVGGADLRVDCSTFYSELCFVQPWTDRVEYLSDLKPIFYKHIPFLELPWEQQIDRDVSGNRQRYEDRVANKGIGMHSSSSLAYDLLGKYRRFDAELAIDESAGNQGSVRYRVILYKRGGDKSTAYQSEIVRGGDAPIPISLDLTDALRMVLIVDFADRGDQLDHANWLDARLIKAK
jgi:hypothetical protein